MSDVQEIVRLADLVERHVLAIGDGHRAKLDELGGNGPLFLRAGALSRRGFDWNDLESFKSDARLNLEAKLGQPGDVVITTKGNSIGRVGWVPTRSPEFVYSPHLSYWRSLDESVLVSRYLYFWAQSNEFLSQLRGLAYGTDMAPYLSLRDQHSFLLPLPSAQKQRAVVDVLGALDDKIAANHRVVHLADDLAQALTWRSFDGSDTHLSEVALVTMGSSPPGESYNERGEGVPFYQGVRDFGIRFPSRRVWTTVPVREAKADDTLVSVRAPVGRTNLAGENLCVGRGLAALRSRAGRPMSLFHQIKSATSVWAPYEAEGTVFGSINKSHLEAVRVPSIVESMADKLEETLSAIEKRISATIAEDARLAATRDELLPLLMSGKVRVRDAEKVVEEVI